MFVVILKIAKLLFEKIDISIWEEESIGVKLSSAYKRTPIYLYVASYLLLRLLSLSPSYPPFSKSSLYLGTSEHGSAKGAEPTWLNDPSILPSATQK